jgi:hypothetical protein
MFFSIAGSVLNLMTFNSANIMAEQSTDQQATVKTTSPTSHNKSALPEYF